MICRRLQVMRGNRKSFLCLLLCLPEGQLCLFMLIDADIFQLQLFIVEDIVHGTQHLQDALHRHTDNAANTGDHGVSILTG